MERADESPRVSRHRRAGGARWVVLANLTITATAGLLVLLLPFVLSPEEYGAWQLYLTLALWLSYATFGLPEGAFVRLAGRDVRDWPVAALGTQVVLLGAVFLVVLAVAAVPALLGRAGGGDDVLYRMLLAALVSALVFVPRTMVVTLLQAQRRFAAFAATVFVERIGLVLLTGLALAIGWTSPVLLAGLDVVAKVAGLVLAVVLARSLLRGIPAPAGEVRADVRASASIGLPLVLVNLAGIALHTVPRLAVERGWGVGTFGHVALAFSASMTMLVLFNALSLASYPDLATAPDDTVRARYLATRRRLAPYLGLSLLTAFPLMILVERLLPEYADAALYLGWLYPALLFEAKARTMTTNYAKRIGAQRALLAATLVALAVGAVWVLVGLLRHDLLVVMLALVGGVAVRGVLADAVLARRLQVPWLGWAAYELALTVAFLVSVAGGLTLRGAVGFAAAGILLTLVPRLMGTADRTGQPRRPSPWE